MKKKTKLMFFIGVIFLVIGGITLILNQFKNNLNDDHKKDEYSIVVDTSNIVGDKIDTTSLQYYESSKYKTISFRSLDLDVKKSYEISYPENLVDESDTDKNVLLVGENLVVEAMCLTDNNYDEYKAKVVDGYKKYNFDKINVSYSDGLIEKQDMMLEYFKISAENKELYTESFRIFIKENDKSFCTVSFSVDSKKFSDSLLMEFINKIKVEEFEANYLYSKIEDEKLGGTLRKKNISPDSKNIEVYYEISSDKYIEIESSENCISSTTFNNKDNIYSIINIELINTINTQFFNTFVDNIKKTYLNNLRFELNDLESNILTLDNNQYYSIKFNHFDNELDVKTFFRYLIYEIDENNYYVVEYRSDEFISDNNIKDFLNIDILDAK